jgi:hypothetical protein
VGVRLVAETPTGQPRYPDTTDFADQFHPAPLNIRPAENTFAEERRTLRSCPLSTLLQKNTRSELRVFS